MTNSLKCFVMTMQVKSRYFLCEKSLKIPKGVIRIRISKNRQYSGQKKKKVLRNKRRSTKHRHITKDCVTRTPIKTGGELRCSGRVGSSCSTSSIRRVILSKYHYVGCIIRVITKLPNSEQSQRYRVLTKQCCKHHTTSPGITSLSCMSVCNCVLLLTILSMFL